MRTETAEKKERNEQAYRRGVADALNGGVRDNGRKSFSNQSEKAAYDEGFYQGCLKKNSYAGGQEDD